MLSADENAITMTRQHCLAIRTTKPRPRFAAADTEQSSRLFRELQFVSSTAGSWTEKKRIYFTDQIIQMNNHAITDIAYNNIKRDVVAHSVENFGSVITDQ